MNLKLIINTKLVLLLTTIITFTTICIFFLVRPQSHSITFPLYGNKNECVNATLNKVHWIDKVNVSFEKFSQVPIGHIGANGYVKILFYDQDKTRIEPIVNAVFQDCYSENLSVLKLQEPKDEYLKTSLPIIFKETDEHSKKVYFEVDLDTNELRYSIWH